MLHHFRKYQQYIYIVVTVVIVISFSFFGTYGTINERSHDSGEAFVAYDGSSISNMELNEYERFFSSDSTDKALMGGYPGFNFLNDGIIAEDILEKKLAFSLFKQLENSIGEETKARFLKERNFQPYKNPRAPFLGAENTWNYFIPEMNKNLSAYKNASDPFEENAFGAKVSLYLGQRKMPAHYLKQVLLYQQSQYGEKMTDRDLNNQDLSLFGYRNLEEWFGPKFIKALAAFIINASMIAEEKGYIVTKEEAQAELMRLAIKSFKENQSSPYMTAANVSQYFQEELRELRMDQPTAIRIWQRAMLFKRLMQDTGGSVFIADLPFKQFHQYSGEIASGTLYALPEEFRLRTPKDLQLLEVYLEAIGASDNADAALLGKLKKTEEITKTAPQLVQKGIVLDAAKVTEGELLSRIGLKDMWRWQVADPSWKLLVKQFPELGLKSASTIDERQEFLDSLDSTTKQRINLFSKQEILKAHPEWIKAALENAPFEEMSFNMSFAEGNSPLPGIENKDLQRAINSTKDKPLALISKDGQIHYLIKVKEAESLPTPLTFAQAKKEGILDKMLEKKLKSHYEKIRGGSPQDYQNADGTWKPLSEVNNKVAEDLFSKTLSNIRKNLPKNIQAETIRDLTPYRLMGYVKHIRDSTDIDSYVKNEDDQGLDAQWKLEKAPFESSRSTMKPPLISDMRGLEIGVISDVIVQPEGDVYFFYLEKKGVKEGLGTLAENALFVQGMLGAQAEKKLFDEMLKSMSERKALDLKILSKESGQ